jgi:hypothetical protein
MKIRTPETQNGGALPVGRLTDVGVRVEFDAAGSVSTGALEPGVYAISVTSDAYLSCGSDPLAGDLAGSLPVPAFGQMTVLVTAEDRIAVRGIAEPGALFAVKLGAA